ncbi:hypothetical protein [Taibaiella sp. KBW10]|uniref:hypothetical protein n=1 Tax=Taibaiella sp. KBW10 TaxID=2153357 RepID=UPI000F58F5F9|nr:hypothetical protein [Taibaiella sp. KBW10]
MPTIANQFNLGSLFGEYTSPGMVQLQNNMEAVAVLNIGVGEYMAMVTDAGGSAINENGITTVDNGTKIENEEPQNDGKENYQNSEGYTLKGDDFTVVLTPFYDSESGILNVGSEVEILYTGKVVGYSKTNWVATGLTNQPLDGYPKNEPFIDANKASAPFYYPNSGDGRDRLNNRDRVKGGKSFYDMPNRAIVTTNMFRIGQVTLVGYKNGQWESIATFQYRYLVVNNTVIYPNNAVQPNATPWPYHQNTLNNLR